MYKINSMHMTLSVHMFTCTGAQNVAKAVGFEFDHNVLILKIVYIEVPTCSK